MSERYITSYTFDEISEILKTIQTCVAKDKFIISQNVNRAENNAFIAKFNLTTAKIKNIISLIEPDSFCYGLHNENVGYEHEILYVFCPQLVLAYGDADEAVDVYSKFNVIDDERVVVISFHQRNYPVNYLFKQTLTVSENKREEGAL